MKKIKKTLAVLLCIILVIAAMPMVAANAEEDEWLVKLNTPVEVTLDGGLGEERLYRFSVEKDGWYRLYSTGEADPYIEITNSDGDFIAYSEDISIEDYNFNLKVQLYAGYMYNLGVGVNDYEEVSFTMMVEETPGVESIEITKEPDNKTVVEGYEYETKDCTGLEAKVTLADGTEYLWSYDDGGMVAGFDVYLDYNDDGQGNYYVDIVCGEVFGRFFFDTIENPVESIEYSCDEMLGAYVNTCGYYDEESNEYIYFSNLPQEATMTVNYKDGTSEEVGVYESVAGAYFHWYDTQRENPWKIGADNYIIVTYLGVTTKVPFTVLPCPFKNVVVNSVPTKEYVFGDIEYGYINDDGSYEFYAEDFSGLSFTVEYEDGTTQQYYGEDIDTEYVEIDGYEYTLEPVTVTEAGVAQITLSYKGYDIKYNVNVIETPLESIEILSDPEVTEFEDRYEPVFDGMQVKLTFKDGTSETVTLSDENTEFIVYGDANYCVTVGEYKLFIKYKYDYETECEYYVLDCSGVSEDYKGIKFTESRLIWDLSVDKLTEDGDSMQVTVTYEDGTTETLSYAALYYECDEDGYVQGAAKTENGIDYYAIEPIYDPEDDTIIVYDVYVLGVYVYADITDEPSVMLGDVDGDGSITVMDATYIQRHLAKIETLEGDALLAADTYDDDQITILDAARIQRLLAKLITEF